MGRTDKDRFPADSPPTDGGDSATRTIRIFLASSIVEFPEERMFLVKKLRSYNDIYHDHGLYFEVRNCEDASIGMRRDGKQAEFDRMARESDYVHVIVGRDVGAATVEEFDAAHDRYLHSGPMEEPKICVYFLDVPDSEVTDRVRDFKARLSVIEKHYYTKFSSVEQILLHIHDELHKDGVFLNRGREFAEGKLRYDGVAARMRENRLRIAELLAQEGAALDTIPELVDRYEENARLAEENHMNLTDLYYYAKFLYRRGEYARAVEAGERLAAINGHEDLTDRADLCVLLGQCRAAMGEPWKAETHYRAALDLYGELAAADPEEYREAYPEAAEARCLLAAYLAETYRFQASERLYREALGLYLELLDEAPDGDTGGAEADDTDAEDGEADSTAHYILRLGQTCHTLAGILRMTGRGAEGKGVSLCGEACLDYAAQRTRDHAIAASAGLRLLRDWLADTECPDTVTPLLRQAEDRARELTADKPEEYEYQLADTCNRLGDQLRQTHRFEESEALDRKGLGIVRRYAAEDPARYELDLANSCHNLADLLDDTRRYGEAEELYREALEIRRRLAVSDPARYEPYLARSCDNLAILLKNTRRYGEAEELHREALEIWRHLAVEDPARYELDLANSCHNLALLLDDTRRYGEAEELYREALEIYRRIAAEDPARYEPYLANSCNNLAVLLKNTRRYGEAEELYREALEIKRRIAAEDPARYEPNLADSCYNLAVLLDDTRRYGEAEELYREALVIYERFPHCADRAANTRHNLSILHARMQEERDAGKRFVGGARL